jgi:hypothetical protein
MTEVSEPAAPARPVPADSDLGGRRWVSTLGAIAAGFTAACCVGLSAAVSLSTALGATFLTRDTTLRPLLAFTLAVTVAGSALTYWRRRQAWPLALSLVSAAWIYSFVYLIGAGHAGAMTDHMADHAVGHRTGFSGGRLAAIWIGLAVLVGSQLRDLIIVRGARRREMPCGDGEPR